MKDRIVADTLIDESKVTVITNSEKKDFVANFNTIEDSFFKAHKGQFIISYVGGFGPHRGLQTAVEGMQEVAKQIPNALLALIGPANTDVKNYLENLIDTFNVRENVLIYESQPFEKVVKIMQSSAINTIPHISNLHTESTIPHKLFQILLSKKPILVSDCAPLKRIIKTNAVGFIFKAGNANSFAEEVLKIYENYSEANLKAEKGFDLAFNGSLNWEHTEKKLLHLYNNLDS